MATGSILLSWPQEAGSLKYVIRYRRTRPDFSNWYEAEVQASSYRLDNQVTGTYEFQISSVGLFGTASSPTVFTYNLNVEAAQSNTASTGLGDIHLTPMSPEIGLLTWTDPQLSGATVLIRHQAPSNTPSWGQSASVLPPVPADNGHVYLPLLTGVYSARLNSSVLTTSVAVTRPEPVRTFLAEIDEAPLFLGVSTGLTTTTGLGISLGTNSSIDTLAVGEDIDTYGYVDGLGLVDSYVSLDSSNYIDSLLLLDDLGPSWDGLTSIDGAGGLTTTGTYIFASVLDAGQVENVYLRRKLVISPSLISDLVDDRSAFLDTWTDLDLLEAGDADVQLYTQISFDNTTWSDWQPFVHVLLRGRYFRFKAVLSSTDPVVNLIISSLGVFADKD